MQWRWGGSRLRYLKEEERSIIGKTLTTLCGTIIDHFDVGPEDERFAEVAYHVYTEIGEVAKTLIDYEWICLIKKNTATRTCYMLLISFASSSVRYIRGILF